MTKEGTEFSNIPRPQAVAAGTDDWQPVLAALTGKPVVMPLLPFAFRHSYIDTHLI